MRNKGRTKMNFYTYKRTTCQNCNKTQLQLSILWNELKDNKEIKDFIYRGLVFEKKIKFEENGKTFIITKICMKEKFENEFLLDEVVTSFDAKKVIFSQTYYNSFSMKENILSINETEKIKEAKSQLALSNLWEKYYLSLPILSSGKTFTLFVDNGIFFQKLTFNKQNEEENYSQGTRFNGCSSNNNDCNKLVFEIERYKGVPYLFNFEKLFNSFQKHQNKIGKFFNQYFDNLIISYQNIKDFSKREI